MLYRLWYDHEYTRNCNFVFNNNINKFKQNDSQNAARPTQVIWTKLAYFKSFELNIN